MSYEITIESDGLDLRGLDVDGHGGLLLTWGGRKGSVVDAGGAEAPLHALEVQTCAFLRAEVNDLVATAELGELFELHDELHRELGIADGELELDKALVPSASDPHVADLSGQHGG